MLATNLHTLSPAPDGSRHPSAMQAAPAVSSSLPGSRCREWSPPQGNADGDALELDDTTAALALTMGETL